MSVGEERFANFFANTPVATTPVGTAPMLVLQNGLTKQVPANQVTVIPPVRTILTANTNYYVSVTGSDSNPGTLASPWATLQHAMNVISSTLDFASFNVFINIGAGSFAGIGHKTTVGGGNLNWVGAGHASTSITAGPNDGTFNLGECYCVNVPTGASTGITDVTLVQPAGNDAIDLSATGGAPSQTFFFGDSTGNLLGIENTITIKPTAGSACSVCIFSAQFSQLQMGPNSTFKPIVIDGSGAGVTFTNIVVCQQDGAAILNISFVGTPNVTGGFPACLFESDGNSYVQMTTAGAVAGNGPVASVTNGSNFQCATLPITGTVNAVVDASSVFNGLAGPFQGINTQTGATYTLVLGDALNIVEMNNAGANTLTVPTNASVAFNIGTKIWVTQTGAGATTIAGAGGVTVNNAGVVGGQWKSVKLYKSATNTWTQTNA